jgi:hypothetical protein
VNPDPDPQPAPEPPPEPPPEPAESLADTEGELQNFMGSDQPGGGEHLHLAREDRRERER